ncbi:MAG: IS4 family transposase [Bacteroidales bacterium]|nr:IS4 family transposase [Bacteroidales bacterium]
MTTIRTEPYQGLGQTAVQRTGKPSLRRFILASAPIKKFYSLGLGRNVTRSNLSKANNTRDPRIFEELAYHTVGVAQRMRLDDIFKLGGKVYAFDSTTIDLCLSVYEWAHFRRAKGGIKVHTLFDLEAQVPTIFHITKAKLHDVNGMDAIPYGPGSFYVFDRAYNDFKRLHHIKAVGSFFVVRAKNALRYQHVRWKRRLPKNVLSDSIIRLTVYKSRHDYPEVLRRIEYYDEEQDRVFVFLTNALSLDALEVANLHKSRWKIELFFK